MAGEVEKLQPDAPKALDDCIVYGAGVEEPLIIESTEGTGIYTTPNGVLTTHFINMSEIYAEHGIIPTPTDWC